MIGGNLATNAGGVNVLRYGNTRDLALGLEAVLPEAGLERVARLRKDNTGYDLKELFIGSEGTLGIITGRGAEAFPRARARSVTAFIGGCRIPRAAVELLALLRGACGERISAFELISRPCVDLVLKHIPGTREPLPAAHPWYVLTELADTRGGDSLRRDFERAVGAAVEAGSCATRSSRRARRSHRRCGACASRYRRRRKAEGLLYRHDISVAVSRMPEFIAAAGTALERAIPGARRDLLRPSRRRQPALQLLRARPQARRSGGARGDRRNDVVHDIVQRFRRELQRRARHRAGQAQRAGAVQDGLELG